MFFLHFSFVVDSAILLTMALIAMAICFPLEIHQLLPSGACGGHCREEFLGHLARCLSAEAAAPSWTLNHPPYILWAYRCFSAFLRWHLHQHLVWIFSASHDRCLRCDFIAVSYIFILRVVFHLSSPGAPQKALHLWFPCLCHPHVLHTLPSSPSSPSLSTVPGIRSSYCQFLTWAIPPALNPIVYGVEDQEDPGQICSPLFTLKKTQWVGSITEGEI